jgi:hypothetical protein
MNARLLPYQMHPTPSSADVLELYVAELGDVIQRLFELHAVNPAAVFKVGALVDRLIAGEGQSGPLDRG